jgi:hypothetical protein
MAGSSPWPSIERVLEGVSARLVYLLLLCPWVFPALGRSKRVCSAGGGIWVARFELEEWTPDKEHAASTASIAFSVSVRVDGEYQTRGESLQLAIEWALFRQCTAAPKFICRNFLLVVLSQMYRELM